MSHAGGAEIDTRSPFAQKAISLLFVIFCMELGIVLVIFPWTDRWSANLFAVFAPQFQEWWWNGYFRGAISGLGVANLYVAVSEILRLRRFAAPPRGSR
jgi:hypothetical protein